MHSARSARCVLVISFALLTSAAFAETVTVRASDTLFSIARAHGTTVDALRQANGLTGDVIRIGMTLRIPGVEAPPGPAAEATPAPFAEPEPAPSSSPASTIHVVQPGDSLFGIARAYGTTADALRRENALASDVIRVGTSLQVPAPPPEAASTEAPSEASPEPVAAAEPAVAEAAAIVPPPEFGAGSDSVFGPTATSAATPTPGTSADPVAADPVAAAPELAVADAPVAGPAPAPQAAATYVVRAGDSLSTIARAHGTTVAALRSANALGGDLIRPGMTLSLPGGVAAAAAAPAAIAYTVRPGDNLYDIAQANGVSVDDLIVWNELDGTIIRPGQRLTLQRRLDTPQAAPLVVTVQSGQSLWHIARAYDTTVASIAAANRIDANGVLRVGQALTIPGRYAPVAAAGFDATPDLGGPAPSTVSVAPGESLWQIANRHDTSVAALMSLNGLNTDRLQVGQTLRVMPGTDLGRAQDALTLPRPDVPQVGMVWPLVGPITSRFGYRRLRIGGTNMHYGLDIDGDVGDPIRAAVGGVVTFAGWRGGFGQLVIVENGETEYYYAHASALLVSEGQRVEAGQLIARVGATGNVTGPHLHFEIRVDGVAVDPLPILEARASR